jgi:hypothetical protein
MSAIINIMSPRRTVWMVLAGVLLVGTASADEKNDTFPVTIVNDCFRTVHARFAVIPPGTKQDQEAKLIENSPVMELPPHSRRVRAMRPHERLVVKDGRGEMSAWFENRQDGEGGRIEIDGTCHGISDTKGPAPADPRLVFPTGAFRVTTAKGTSAQQRGRQ